MQTGDDQRCIEEAEYSAEQQAQGTGDAGIDEVGVQEPMVQPMGPRTK